MERREWFPVVAFCVVAWSGMAWGGEEAEDQGDLDTIIRYDRKTVPPTKITQDDYFWVKGSHKNVPTAVRSFLVEEVHYAGQDSRFADGLARRKSGKHLTAAKLFRLAQEGMHKEKWAQEYCSFYIGDALYQAEKYEGYTDKSGHRYLPPSNYFDQVVKSNPKSRFLLESLVKKAICLAREGKVPEAEAAFKTALDRIKSFRDEVMAEDTGYLAMADRARAMAKLGEAALSENKADLVDKGAGNYAAALQAYKGAQSMAGDKFPEINGEAFDGELRVLIKMGDYSGARDQAQRVVDKFREKAHASLYPMLPGAYVAMGKANFKQAGEMEAAGQALQAEKLYAEARWNFLHVIVQFFDNSEYMAVANFFAGLCYEKLKDKEPGALEKAIHHWQVVRDTYKLSNYAKMATEKLAVVKPPEPVAPAPDKSEKGEKKDGAKEGVKEAPAPKKEEGVGKAKEGAKS